MEEAGRIHLSWIESNGPHVRTPSRRGFGTKMISGIFEAEPGWSVSLDFEPGGLRCIMQFSPMETGRKNVPVAAAAG
jgi:two-component sensor histidine kinase